MFLVYIQENFSRKGFSGIPRKIDRDINTQRMQRFSLFCFLKKSLRQMELDYTCLLTCGTIILRPRFGPVVLRTEPSPKGSYQTQCEVKTH